MFSVQPRLGRGRLAREHGAGRVGLILLAHLRVPLTWGEIFKRTFHEAFTKDNCLGMAAQLVCIAVFILTSFALIIAGPTLATQLAERFSLGPVFEWSWKILQWPVVFLIAGVGIAMIYLSGLVVLIGAEMNAVIEHASPYGKDVGEKVSVVAVPQSPPPALPTALPPARRFSDWVITAGVLGAQILWTARGVGWWRRTRT